MANDKRLKHGIVTLSDVLPIDYKENIGVEQFILISKILMNQIHSNIRSTGGSFDYDESIEKLTSDAIKSIATACIYIARVSLKEKSNNGYSKKYSRIEEVHMKAIELLSNANMKLNGGKHEIGR